MADGSDLASLWKAGSFDGQSIVSSTTSYDVQGTEFTGTPASSLAYDVITPWGSGVKIQNSNGLVYYYDGVGDVQNLGGWAGSGPVVAVSGLDAAINFANGNATTDVTYSDGGYDHYTTYHGLIVSEEWSDGHGSYGTLTTTYPAGQSPIGSQAVITRTTTNAAGYTTVTVSGKNDVTTRYYPDGTVAEVSRSEPSTMGLQADMLRDLAGNVLSSTYTDPTSANATPTVQTISTDAVGDTITTLYTYRAVDYSYVPSTATSTWTTQDGTHVSATFDLSTGAGTETINYVDGTYSVVSNNASASGGYFARNYDASGTLVSDVWQDGQGSNGIDTIQASGVIDSTATYHLAQGVTETASTTTQADGSYVRTWTKTDGSTGTDTHNADGTGSGTVQYANGTSSTYTSTEQGVVTTLDYDASGNQVDYAVAATDSAGNWLQTTYDLNGVRLRDQWTHADGTTGSDVFNADGSVETKTSLTDASGVTTITDTITQPDGSFQRTWNKSDGSSGTDIRNADGSMSGISDSPTGGHGTYTDDGHGDVSHTVTATADSQVLVGASVGVNILQAGAAYSNVTLQGGPGSDIFVLNAAAGSQDVAALGDGSNVVYGQDGNDEVDLGAGNNTINLGNGSNYIGSTQLSNAGNGNNAIYLGDGQNTVWLGDGDNVLGVGTGLDSIHVGNGKNKIWGGSGNNQINVGDGNDTIGLGSGNNIVKTGNGASSVSVGDGMNQIWLGGGANTVSAGAGANIIRGGNGDNAAYAGNGDNDVEFGGGNNTVGLGTGNNIVILGGGSNTIYAGHGTGSNTIFVGDGANTVTVADGANYINAGSGADHVYGGSGDNTIWLGNGVDTVNLGDGDNSIHIRDGDSAVYVGNGNNQITLGRGNDVVSAGNGSNTLTTGDGNSTIWMGAGNNQIQVGNGNNTVGIGGAVGSTNTIQVGDGNNTIVVAAGTNTIRVGNGTDAVQTGNGVNTIQLGSGQVTLTNYGGQDTVTFASSVQDDQLWFAQDGNDLLVTVDGTSSNLRLTDWFNGATHATLVAGDGHQLIDSQVASLVQSMSQFSPPAVGQTTLPQAQQDSLTPVIAASWR